MRFDLRKSTPVPCWCSPLYWVVACALPCALAPHLFSYRLRLNVSASVPLGLYLQLPPPRAFVRGTLVLFPPPASIGPLMMARGWLAPGVPLLKPVAALAHDTVCMSSDGLLINRVRYADPAPTQDRHGHPLPLWTGCRVLLDDELFVLSIRIPTAIDSRHFGPISRRMVIGRALPLLTWPDPRTDDNGNHNVMGLRQDKAMICHHCRPPITSLIFNVFYGLPPALMMIGRETKGEAACDGDC